MYFSELERKISVRSTRDELIKKGVIKERVDDAIIEANENQSNATTTTTTIQADTTTTATSPDTTVVTAQHNHAPCITETGELPPLILINYLLPLESILFVYILLRYFCKCCGTYSVEYGNCKLFP